MPQPKKYARVLIKNAFKDMEIPTVKGNVVIVNVFSIDNKGGNPCAVVDNAGHLSTEEMQRIASGLKFPETVFIIRNKYQYVLRFFATKKDTPISQKTITIIRGKLMPKLLPNIKLRAHLQRSSGKCSSLTGYLKRHYLRLDKSYSSTEEADLAAIELGSNWVKEQLSSLHLLKMPVEIISWKALLEEIATAKDKPFLEYLDRVKATYRTDEAFAREVDILSKKYGEKLSCQYNPNREKSLDEACFEAAKNYLLEESSIIFKLVPRGFNAQIYPGNRNAALRYIYKKFFRENNPIPWIRYDIK